MKVPRIRKCLIVGTRSVRRASGLLETGFSVSCSRSDPAGQASFRKARLFGYLAVRGRLSGQPNLWAMGLGYFRKLQVPATSAKHRLHDSKTVFIRAFVELLVAIIQRVSYMSDDPNVHLAGGGEGEE